MHGKSGAVNVTSRFGFKSPSLILTKCSASSSMRKIQIKTTLRFHLTPVRTAKINKAMTAHAGEYVGKGKPLLLLREYKLVELL